jgi:hypothetical protein
MSLKPAWVAYMARPVSKKKQKQKTKLKVQEGAGGGGGVAQW